MSFINSKVEHGLAIGKHSSTFCCRFYLFFVALSPSNKKRVKTGQLIFRLFRWLRKTKSRAIFVCLFVFPTRWVFLVGYSFNRPLRLFYFFFIYYSKQYQRKTTFNVRIVLVIIIIFFLFVCFFLKTLGQH